MLIVKVIEGIKPLDLITTLQETQGNYGTELSGFFNSIARAEGEPVVYKI